MRTLAAFAAPGLLVLSSLASAGCNTYAAELERGQHAFEASEHERALALFRALEPDMAHLEPNQRARYCYLRGMTDFRIGYKAESRHWLALAQALEKQTPGSLPADWSHRMTDALNDLNEAVYSGGIASLSNTASQNTGAATDHDDHGDDEAAPAPSSSPKKDGDE
jgi:hypothetical protein